MKILVKSEWREYEVIELANRAPGYKDIIVGGTPDGHYIDFVGDHAHLFAVGCYQGDGAYERSLIGFEMIGQQRINLPSRPEFDGRVVRIDFRKRPPETEQDRQRDQLNERRPASNSDLWGALAALHDLREFWHMNVTQTYRRAGHQNPMWARVANILDRHGMNNPQDSGKYESRFYVWDNGYYGEPAGVGIAGFRQQPDPGLGSVPDGGDALAAATLPAAPEKPSSTARNGNPHPAAEVPNASTFNGMEAGCRFVSTVTGEHGWVDEFLPNGKALVTFDRSGWARVLSIKVVPEIILVNEKAPFLATQKE